MLGDLHTLCARSFNFRTEVDFKGKYFFLLWQEKINTFLLVFWMENVIVLLWKHTPPVPFTVKEQAFLGMLLVPFQTKSDAECRLVWPPVCNILFWGLFSNILL